MAAVTTFHCRNAVNLGRQDACHILPPQTICCEKPPTSSVLEREVRVLFRVARRSGMQYDANIPHWGMLFFV